MASGLSVAVDERVGIDIDSLSEAALDAEFVEIRREIDKLEHHAATLLARMHHRGVPGADGASSTPVWVQWKTGQRVKDARQSLMAGLALAHLPLTDKAWVQGEISASAARTICSGRVEAHGEVYAAIEEKLVGYAAAHELERLDVAIGYFRNCCDALDGKAPADLNGLHLSQTLGRRWVSNGNFDDLSGHVVQTALDAAMGGPLPEDDRSPAKRRADALVEICEYFLEHADLPVEAGERPHLSVDLPWEMIIDGLPCREVAFGPTLTPDQVRQVLCDSRISRIITGPDSQILDVGREERTATRAQRRALAKRDGGCRFPGCDRLPNRCQAHHVWEWDDGGATDLDNMLLLCKFHHGLIHRRGWSNTFEAGIYRVFRPDGTLLGQT